jgi:hypothetical protein
MEFSFHVILAVGEEIPAGRVHRKRHAVVGCPPVTAPSRADRHVMQARFAETVVERASAVDLPAVCDRIDSQRTEDRREPADVVAVGNLSTLQSAVHASETGRIVRGTSPKVLSAARKISTGAPGLPNGHGKQNGL